MSIEDIEFFFVNPKRNIIIKKKATDKNKLFRLSFNLIVLTFFLNNSEHMKKNYSVRHSRSEVLRVHTYRRFIFIYIDKT